MFPQPWRIEFNRLIVVMGNRRLVPAKRVLRAALDPLPQIKQRAGDALEDLLSKSPMTSENVFRYGEGREHVSLDIQFTVNECFPHGELGRLGHESLQCSGSVQNQCKSCLLLSGG